MIRSHTLGRLLLMVLILAAPLACKKKPQEPRDPAQIYNEGLSFMSAGERYSFLNPPDYEKARESFQEILFEHPTSRYAPLAELRLADIYYEQGDYETSVTAYDSWRKNHVGRPEIPYVIYRIGMSYYHQILSIDRDQTDARLALYEFQNLVGSYPNSEYAAAVGDKTEILKTRLAEHEFYVGKYYYRHKDYWAAIDRFRSILDNFSRRGLDEKALYWSWRSYTELGRFQEANETLNIMNKRFPEGELVRRATSRKGKKSEGGVKEWLSP